MGIRGVPRTEGDSAVSSETTLPGPGLSTHAVDMPRSGIRQIMDLAWATGPDVIGLHVGEPSFDTPSHVIDATRKALADGATRYVPNAGLPELRSAITRKLNSLNGIPASFDDVVVTAGGMEALLNAFIAVLSPGDEVLLPDPGWPNYAMLTQLLGVKPSFYQLSPENGFLPDVDQIAARIGPRTRAIVINTPSNPLGTVLDSETLRQLLGLARDHDLWIISDECYDAITFEPDHISPASLDPGARVLSCFTFSKTYSMTGFRVGYVASPPGDGSTLAKLQEPLVACVNAAAQWGALAALEGPQEQLTANARVYQRRRDHVCNFLDELGVAYVRPQGAFYLWIDVSHLCSDVASFCADAVTNRKVAVAPGSTFGRCGEGYVRISLSASDADLLEGLRRLLTV